MDDSFVRHYHTLRQMVVAKLVPETRADPVATRQVLEGLAWLALHRDAQRAALDLLTAPGPEPPDWGQVEDVCAGLVNLFPTELRLLRVLLARHLGRGLAAGQSQAAVQAQVLAALKTTFIRGTPTASPR
jgi:hypothetical protein